MTYLISDLITFNSTNSVSIMEELRQARLAYDPSNPLGGTTPSISREDRVLSTVPTQVMAALRQLPLEVRFSETSITRVCLRLGISPRPIIRSTRTLRR